MGRIYQALHKSGGTLPEFAPSRTPGTEYDEPVDLQGAPAEAPSGNDPSRLPEQTELTESAAAGNDRNGSELDGVRVVHLDVHPNKRIVVYSDPHGPGADRFRFLRLRLRELAGTRKLKTVIITSAQPAEGKSTVCLNLATALAEGGKRTVLVVDVDFYRRTLSHILGLRSGPGLAECLEDNLDPVSALRRIEPLSWYLLTAGEPRRNPTELLQSDSLAAALRKLYFLFEWILIDTPPVVPLADTLSLSRHADASLLVVRAGQTPREAIDDALTLLGPTAVGIVLNGAEKLNRAYYKYYGHYHIKSDAMITEPPLKRS